MSRVSGILVVSSEFSAEEIPSLTNAFDSAGLDVEVRRADVQRSDVTLWLLLLIPLKGALAAIGSESMKALIQKLRQAAAGGRVPTNGPDEAASLTIKDEVDGTKFVVPGGLDDAALQLLADSVNSSTLVKGATYVFNPESGEWRRQ